jgi:hypothetical protein
MTCEVVLRGIMSRGPTGLFPERNRWELPKSILKLFIIQQSPGKYPSSLSARLEMNHSIT